MTQVTSGRDWRQPKTAIVLLPSGNYAEVRNVKIGDVVALLGNVPDTLTPVAQKALFDILDNGLTQEKMEQMSPIDLMQASGRLFDVIAKLAFVNPKVVDDPANDNEIAVSDIDDVDKEWVMGLLRMPAAHLATFCRQQTEIMESLRPHERTGGASKQDSGHIAVVETA